MLVRRHLDRVSFVRSLHLHYSVRLHAAILLLAAAIVGLLLSRLLLWAGMETPLLRFPIAVIASYGIFLVFIDWWLHYIGIKRAAVDDVPDPGAYPSSGRPGETCAPREGFDGGGGSFDGGGASGGFDASPGGQLAAAKGEVALRAKASALHVGLEAKAQGGLSAGEALTGAAGLGEIFFPIVLFLAVLAGMVAAWGWVVVATPAVMVETAVEIAVASGLIRSISRTRDPAWFASLFSRTVWKAAALAAAALLIGFAVRAVDPSADTIGEAVAHVMAR